MAAVAVGEECYLTLDKGAINEAHVLVLPIEHYPSTLSCSKGFWAEMEQYLSALRSYYAAQVCKQQDRAKVQRILYCRSLYLHLLMHLSYYFTPLHSPNEQRLIHMLGCRMVTGMHAYGACLHVARWSQH